MGDRPHVRVYVHLDEIFDAAEKYSTNENLKPPVLGSGLYLQPCGNRTPGSLKHAIGWMGRQTTGRMRFFTKYHRLIHSWMRDMKGTRASFQHQSGSGSLPV
jgi:spore photoproduct lyase